MSIQYSFTALLTYSRCLLHARFSCCCQCVLPSSWRRHSAAAQLSMLTMTALEVTLSWRHVCGLYVCGHVGSGGGEGAWYSFVAAGWVLVQELVSLTTSDSHLVKLYDRYMYRVCTTTWWYMRQSKGYMKWKLGQYLPKYHVVNNRAIEI